MQILLHEPAQNRGGKTMPPEPTKRSRPLVGRLRARSPGLRGRRSGAAPGRCRLRGQADARVDAPAANPRTHRGRTRAPGAVPGLPGPCAERREKGNPARQVARSRRTSPRTSQDGARGGPLRADHERPDAAQGPTHHAAARGHAGALPDSSRERKRGIPTKVYLVAIFFLGSSSSSRTPRSSRPSSPATPSPSGRSASSLKPRMGGSPGWSGSSRTSS
jgi:hypothetical protein